MVMKCYNKPKRTKIRYFSVCDAARVSRDVAEREPRDKIISTIGFSLGYFRLVDGSKFTEDEVRREIEEAITILDAAGELALLIPGSVVWKTVIFVVRRFTSRFAILIAPIVLYLLNKHIINGAITCGGSNG